MNKYLKNLHFKLKCIVIHQLVRVRVNYYYYYFLPKGYSSFHLEIFSYLKTQHHDWRCLPNIISYLKLWIINRLLFCNNMLLYKEFELSQTIFQPNLSAGGRTKPVHQVLHHWHGWRNGHLGCQGNTHSHTYTAHIHTLHIWYLVDMMFSQIYCCFWLFPFLFSDSGVCYEGFEDSLNWSL